MEEKIFAENDDAYRATYSAIYPKESKRHFWDDIQGEWLRVKLLNSRKPAGAEDIQTYGSRIGGAILKAVNIARFPSR
jgi:hypothetical protein